MVSQQDHILPNVAEVAALLSEEDKFELQRRRAAELSGEGGNFPVELGGEERRESEVRRMLNELALAGSKYILNEDMDMGRRSCEIRFTKDISFKTG